MKTRIRSRSKVTVGLDLGDKFSVFYSIDTDGELLSEGRLKTTPEAMEKHFGSMEPARIAIETSGHSPWLSRLLESLGHEVLVANSRELRLIESPSPGNCVGEAGLRDRVSDCSAQAGRTPSCIRSSHRRLSLGPRRFSRFRRIAQSLGIVVSTSGGAVPSSATAMTTVSLWTSSPTCRIVLMDQPPVVALHFRGSRPAECNLRSS